ncbi:MAG: FtsQ-type POTRA domain-containing protein [Chitinispirillaceae bacterium]|nr:FtsQ-type POTRA domain-containing protein [Chitinispirillaceae bacterium]
MRKRKGANSQRKYVQRKRQFASRLRRLIPVTAAAGAVALSIVAGTVYGGIAGYEKIIGAIDRSRLFTVRKISVSGNERIAVTKVLKRCGITTSMKIYRVKKATVAAALLADPWIEKVRCVRRWWGTVALEIKERIPIALVAIGEVRLIDRSGVFMPVEPGKSYDLPLISALRTSVDGKGNRYPDSVSIARAGRFIERACAVEKTIFRTITQLDISDTGGIRCMVAGRPVVIDIGYDADAKQLRNVRYLLERLAGGAPAATRIDVRYQNLAFVCREPSGPPHARRVND